MKNMGRKSRKRRKTPAQHAASTTTVFRHIGATTFNKALHRSWQNRGSSGAAGECKRIDPATGQVIEILNVENAENQ
jgi:hypothetical protein